MKLEKEKDQTEIVSTGEEMDGHGGYFFTWFFSSREYFPFAPFRHCTGLSKIDSTVTSLFYVLPTPFLPRPRACGVYISLFVTTSLPYSRRRVPSVLLSNLQQKLGKIFIL